ncbi:hypothetical protein [Lutibacter sp.]|uniref:hypothetical protein n=1 Tax=Lutibacter sp. TaxID=1925666 RepID=UPI0025C2E109|nr:hypothetical protein [Lutibacter sp.]MCF6182767.1 hypothetical protein [Lutibacter sp.]
MMIFWFICSIMVLILILVFKENIEPNNNIDTLDILDKRYTNSEITKDEYLEQKKAINLKKGNKT